jgi:integrase
MTECGPGKWRLQVAVASDLVSGERRRISRTFHGSQSEAKEALQRMAVEAGAGLYGGGRVTIGDLLDQFMASATLAPTTRTDWMSVAERHLKPALGAMELWKLTPRHCDQLYARMRASGLGQSRVRCAHVVLHRVVAQAVRWGWLARNPVSNATRPALTRVAIKPPGAEAVRVALETARLYDPSLCCWLQLAVATGRAGARSVPSGGPTSTSTTASCASTGRSRRQGPAVCSSSPQRRAGHTSCRSPSRRPKPFPSAVALPPRQPRPLGAS